MDRTGISPLLPLDFWRQEIGYSPWHFWGIADNTIIPVTSRCNTLVYEYSWQQADQAGRADIRAAIITSEQILFDNLQFWPAPAYSVETHPWPRYIDQRLMRYGRSDVRGGWIPIQLGEGEIQACGVQALDLITASAPVVYADNDGDGISEDFTVTIASTVSEDEIAIYFIAADRVAGDDDIDPRWRIEPVNVKRSGANLLITGKRWLVVKPKLYESQANTPIDPLDNTKFASTVDVYRRYTYMDGTDSQSDSQSALIWESRPCRWGCNSNIPNSHDPASEGWVAGRSGIRHSEDGIVIPAEAVYNAVTGSWEGPNSCISVCSEPDKVLIRYLAGRPLDIQGHMYKPMRTLVSRLACAEMPRRICACDTANREWSYWQFDISRADGPETYQSFNLVSNPLGTRRGHIYAWNQIKSLARTVGMLA